jgi:hypothetical protein
MSFVRTELAARLRPWREALVWAAGSAAGAWLAWQGWATGAILLLLFGLLLVAVSVSLLVTELRRRRLRGQEPAEGMVVVEEARIGYFGPRGGGFIDLDALARVEIMTDGSKPAWRLEESGGASLRIPVGARGAEDVYDALAPFARLDEEALHTALATRRSGRFPVWVSLEHGTLERLP